MELQYNYIYLDTDDTDVNMVAILPPSEFSDTPELEADEHRHGMYDGPFTQLIIV